MVKITIPKSEMLGILGDRGEDVPDNADITAVNLTEDSVEFDLEEKAEEESGGE